MDFRKIRFTKAEPDKSARSLPKELRDLDYPWFDAEMSRLVFKDCKVRIVLVEDYFDDYGEDGVERLKSTVPLTASVEVAGALNDFHENAYNHFIQNAGRYEKRLLDYLLLKIQRNVAAALENNDSRELRAFIKMHALDADAGIKKQIEWQGLTLYDHGWDSIGFIAADFNCGWDEEHGISILMHRDKVIVEGGLAEFSNRGKNLIAHAKCAQMYTTEYDIVLP